MFDLIFSLNVGIIGNVDIVAPFLHCMHCPVLKDVFLPAISQDHSDKLSNKKLWIKGNYSNMCQALKTLHWESIFEGLSVDERYNVLMNMYNDLVERFFPQRQSDKVPRWIRHPPRPLLRRRIKAWAKYIRMRN